MKKLKITEATASLAEYARQLNHGPLVVTENGKPIAALVPVEGVDWESLAVGTSPKFLDIIERSRRRHEAEGGISIDEMRERLGLKRGANQRSKSKSRKPQPVSRTKKNDG